MLLLAVVQRAPKEILVLLAEMARQGPRELRGPNQLLLDLPDRKEILAVLARQVRPELMVILALLDRLEPQARQVRRARRVLLLL